MGSVPRQLTCLAMLRSACHVVPWVPLRQPVSASLPAAAVGQHPAVLAVEGDQEVGQPGAPLWRGRERSWAGGRAVGGLLDLGCKQVGNLETSISGLGLTKRACRRGCRPVETRYVCSGAM